MPPTADIEPGDLILVTKGGGDPLADFVCRLDGTTWSHCGIAVSDGRVANCRTGPVGWDVKDPGGIRLDEIGLFVAAGREVWRARPQVEQHVLDRAVRFAEWFGSDGEPGAQQSGFGFAKLFLVSCALVGVSPSLSISEDGRRAIVRSATRAARILSWTRLRPFFFCSEFVGAAYARPFTEADLFLPRQEDVVRREPTTAERVEGFLDRVNAEVAGTRGGLALLDLIGVMGTYQASYLVKALDTVVKWREFEEEQEGKKPPVEPAPVPDGDPPPPVDVPPLPLDALPQCLVTPRMLAHASWMAKPELVASPTTGTS